eukprot:2664644-Rhodomonas_salina.1
MSGTDLAYGATSNGVNLYGRHYPSRVASRYQPTRPIRDVRYNSTTGRGSSTLVPVVLPPCCTVRCDSLLILYATHRMIPSGTKCGMCYQAFDASGLPSVIKTVEIE